MEETVSVLIWECWLWEDTMDMTDWARLLLAGSSGEEMVEESGVPVQDDWSTAPEDDRVRFSLSGVTPHSWRDTEEGGEGQAPGKEGDTGRA